MANEIQVDGASWPGIPSFEQCFATFSHGHEPAAITGITSVPPTGVPAYGDFVFSDGHRSFVIKDCKLAAQRTDVGPGGYTYTYHFLDRRWRWRFGEISGHYNARDRRDNLIPWMAKTPIEMAKLLLDQMGEKNYVIDLPDGVSADELDTTRNNPAPGEKTPETRTNPEVLWDGENPAVALDRLCQQFNRRLMLDPVRNIVVIARPGYGSGLPDNDFLDTVEESIEAFATPNGIGILGDYIRSQMHLKLVPVGEEWDGRFVPIEELSYRPGRLKVKGKWRYTFVVTALQVGQIDATFGGIPVTSGAATGAASTASQFQSAANAAPGLSALATITASNVGTTVTVDIEEVKAGQGLDFTFSALVNGADAGARVEQLRVSNGSAWELSDPNSFYDVIATDRLSYQAARSLALKSVFRYYRVADEDVSEGWDAANFFEKIYVPGYGKIDRRERLLLQDSLVEQVVPAERDEERTDAGNSQFLSENPDRYDGYSRDRKAVVYGQVAVECNGDWFGRNYRQNTPPNKRVAVQFAIDPVYQIVMFANPMYRIKYIGSSQRRVFAKLVLETSVLVKDEKRNTPIRFRRWVEFARQTPEAGTEPTQGSTTTVNLRDYTLTDGQPQRVEIKNPKDNHNNTRAGQDTIGIEWYHHVDVPYAIVGVYAFKGEAHGGYRWLRNDTEEDDVSRPRADYYLAGHLLEHQVRGGQTAGYIGIHPFAMDGAIAQVSYEVGSGATTRASRNCEHSYAVPPLNARRRAENLKADEKATAQNYAENAKFSTARLLLSYTHQKLAAAGNSVAKFFTG